MTDSDDSERFFAPDEDDMPIGIGADAAEEDEREPYSEVQDRPIRERVAQGRATGTNAAGGIVPFPPAKSGQDAIAALPYSETKRVAYLKSAGYRESAHAYRDAEGDIILVIAQYRKDGEAKQVRPLRYLGKSTKTGEDVYWWTGIPGTRPLYGLDHLAQRPAAPVLCVEGEKTADAARALFPDHVVITWPGGAGRGAVDRVDVSDLAGRELVGWPDQDLIGRAGMRRFLARALEAGATSAGMVMVPDDFPPKWDLADPAPASFAGPDALRDLVRAARPINKAEAAKLLANPRKAAEKRRLLGLSVGYSKVEPGAVETALGMLDPDESGLWFRVLRCLFYAFGREVGLALADAWSQRGDKYKAGEVALLFDKFAVEEDFSAKTLFWLFKKAERAAFETAQAGKTLNEQLDLGAFALAHIEDMNCEHAVVTRGGKTVVMWEYFDQRFDRYSTEYLPKQAFVDRHVATFPGESAKGKPTRHARGYHWFHDGRRQQFDRVVFLPGQKAEWRTLNAWRGFTVEPADDPSGWALLKAHLRENVCQGNDQAYAYLLDWLAACVQWLDRPLGVALVLTGHKGAGKSIIIQFLAHLFGEAAFVTSLADDVLGKFNARLEHTLLLGLEEAVAANSRAQDGALKDLITRNTLRLEDKFFSNWTAPNRLRLIMTSNNDFVVRADARERRYFVLEVANPHQDDAEARRKYFGEMVEQMETGGYEAMLGELLGRNISRWNPEKIPETEALRQQKMLNLSNDPMAAWWYSRLEDGVNVLSGEGETDLYPWHPIEVTWVPVADLARDYRAFARAHGHRADDRRLKAKLARYMPPDFESKTRRNEADVNKAAVRMYPIPPRAECIRRFALATGYEVGISTDEASEE